MTIEEYIGMAPLPAFLMKEKLDQYKRNPDIANEFEIWINERRYIEGDSAVCILGYTAKKISELSSILDGESAFEYLIGLREAPEQTVKRLKQGFFIRL